MVKLFHLQKKHGTRRDDLSNENDEIYEMKMNDLFELRSLADDVRAFSQGSKHLPTIMIVGLVSTYDNYVAKLLESVFTKKPSILSSSAKDMTFADLCRFDSIEEARSSIVAKEVETVIRMSHHDQFDWMEKRFAIPLREGLSILPIFIELCERRNLFAHTGGFVSKQYLAAGQTHKYDVTSVKVGDQLEADPLYFNIAVEAVYEVGAKLGYVLWRKFADENVAAIDEAFNNLAYGLIYKKHYAVAEKLLGFAVETLNKRKGLEATRRRMVINLANACRLQGNKEKAAKILGREDWSAVDDVFNICIAAVREETKEVARLIRKLGRSDSMSSLIYKTWPVFRGVDMDEDVRKALLDVFGEEMIPVSAKKDLDDNGHDKILLH